MTRCFIATEENSVTTTATTTVLEVSGVHWASSKSVAESVLSRRPGVLTFTIELKY